MLCEITDEACIAKRLKADRVRVTSATNGFSEQLLKMFAYMTHPQETLIEKTSEAGRFCVLSNARTQRQQKLKLPGSMQNPQWKRYLKNNAWWSCPCDISCEQTQRETAEAGWFYAKSEMETLVGKRMKLVVSA